MDQNYNLKKVSDRGFFYKIIFLKTSKKISSYLNFIKNEVMNCEDGTYGFYYFQKLADIPG